MTFNPDQLKEIDGDQTDEEAELAPASVEGE